MTSRPIYNRQRGFTLSELMMAIAIFSMAMAGAYSVYFTCYRCYWKTDVQTRTAHITAMTIQKMFNGYNGSNGLRSAVTTTTNVTLAATNGAWSIAYQTPDGMSHRFYYATNSQCILYSNSTWAAGRIGTVATYVVASSIANGTNGVSVYVRSRIREGNFSASNAMTSFIQYRN